MSLSEGAILLCTLFLALSLAALCVAGMFWQMSRARALGWHVTSVTVLLPEEDDDER